MAIEIFCLISWIKDKSDMYSCKISLMSLYIHNTFITRECGASIYSPVIVEEKGRGVDKQRKWALSW